MTYRELYDKATKQLEKSEITLGEYEEMTKPLDREIEERKVGKWLSAEEYALRIGTEVTEDVKKSLYKFCPFCEQTVFMERNFCPNCGASFKEKRDSEDE